MDERRQSEREERARRRDALSGLAGQRAEPTPAASATRGADWASTRVSQSSSHFWRLVLAPVVLAAVVLGIVGYVVWPRPAHPTTKATPPPSLINLSQSGLACYQDAAWSPDGTLIAVLGYKLNCPTFDPRGYAYTPGQLDIYVAASGTLATQIKPDDPITQALHLTPPKNVKPSSPASNVSHQVIEYRHVLWSPDGKQLALSFQIEPRTADDNPTSSTDGVLLTDLTGTRSRTLAHTSSPTEFYSGEWNLTTGAYLPVPTSATISHPAPPAMSFAWGADGALIGQGPSLSLTSLPPAPALGPIGNPIGGATFSVWQPASVQPITEACDAGNGSGSAPCPYYFFNVNVPAWSPDGSHLILDIRTFDLLVSDGSPIPTGNLGGHPIQAQGLLPMRDKGLAAALADARLAPPTDTNIPVIQVLWRPDGRVIAMPFVPSSSPDDPTPPAPAVRLYDCATGHLLSTLREPIEPTSQASPPTTVRWSPDGTHLLLLDFTYRSLTIWGPKQLPHA